MKRYVPIRMDESLYRLIENFAKTKNITVSEAVRTIIREYFNNDRHELSDYIVSKAIANDELFYNLVKAKLLVDERAKVILREILKELD